MNRTFPRVWLFLVAALLLQISPNWAQTPANPLCLDGECQPAIAATEYQGRKAYKLTDGQTEAIVVPEIGRIMSFGKVGGPNLLWNLGGPASKGMAWKNYGGDKTWLAPQTSWPAFHGAAWPPDSALDGQAQQAEVLTGGKVRLTSPLSKSGIRLTRVMYFDAGGEFVIEQTIRKEIGAPIQASIWDVCQIVPGEAIFLPRDEGSKYPHGFAAIRQPTEKQGESQKIDAVLPHLLRVIPLNSGGGAKIGVDSAISSIASVRDGVAFLQKTTKPAGIYPDAQGGAGFSTELFTFGNPQAFYCEIELLGPLKTFAVGGKSTQTLRWSLHNLPSKDVHSPAAIDAVEKLLYAQ